MFASVGKRRGERVGRGWEEREEGEGRLSCLPAVSEVFASTKQGGERWGVGPPKEGGDGGGEGGEGGMLKDGSAGEEREREREEGERADPFTCACHCVNAQCCS